MSDAATFAGMMKFWMRPLGRHATSALLVLSVLTAARAADNEAPPGFTSFFNGHDLAGWKVPEGDGGHWKVVDARSITMPRVRPEETKAFGWNASSATSSCMWTGGSRKHLTRTGMFTTFFPTAPTLGTYMDRNSSLPCPTPIREYFYEDPAMPGKYLVLAHRLGRDVRHPHQPSTAPELRAAVTPRMQADNPIGQWNRFEITVRGNTVRTVLNGKVVIPGDRSPICQATAGSPCSTMG